MLIKIQDVRCVQVAGCYKRWKITQIASTIQQVVALTGLLSVCSMRDTSRPIALKRPEAPGNVAPCTSVTAQTCTGCTAVV
jgi:hypothetical protein